MPDPFGHTAARSLPEPLLGKLRPSVPRGENMHVQLLRRVVTSLILPFAIAFITTGARAATPNERYANLAYSDLLARAPTPGELSGYTTILDNATLTRTQFASSLLGSGEFCDDKTISFFSLLLHRNAA